MRPPWSMIIFTTLAGAAQGLMLVLLALDAMAAMGVLSHPSAATFLGGAALVLGIAGAGLVAATFHLGHPERAWRAMAQWRTSWLSREVIVMPAFMAMVFLWGLAQWLGLQTLLPGIAAAVLALALFICTGMIYAAVHVIREWATPLTPLNFVTMGLASGAVLATALAAFTAPALTGGLATLAAAATVLAALARAASLWRNASLAPRTTMQSALGVRHPRIVQISQGAMGGSFNTREYFHGADPGLLPRLRWGVAVFAFVLPASVLGLRGAAVPAGLLVMLVLMQYIGLLGERWLFFAEGRHPQNLYYQRIG